LIVAASPARADPAADCQQSSDLESQIGSQRAGCPWGAARLTRWRATGSALRPTLAPQTRSAIKAAPSR